MGKSNPPKTKRNILLYIDYRLNDDMSFPDMAVDYNVTVSNAYRIFNNMNDEYNHLTNRQLVILRNKIKKNPQLSELQIKSLLEKYKGR